MTPTEQAIELVNKFHDKISVSKSESFETAKECALLCVERIMKTHPVIEYEKPINFWDSGIIKVNANHDYWNSVYESIQSL